MFQIKPLSEFNRNQTAFIEELHKNGQPVYLTRNGSAELVVMDAEVFNREMSFRANIYAEEMRVYHNLMRGYAEVLEGNLIDGETAEAEFMKAKGWA